MALPRGSSHQLVKLVLMPGLRWGGRGTAVAGRATEDGRTSACPLASPGQCCGGTGEVCYLPAIAPAQEVLVCATEA